MSNIVERFSNLAVRPGGILFFSADDALKVVDVLEKAKCKILGIDAFKITPTSTQPVMEEDMPAIQTDDSWTESREFLTRQKDKGLMFEIVADE